MGLRRVVCLLPCVLVLAAAGPVDWALATYPGMAGTIEYQDAYSTFDPLNNGAVTYVDSLRAVNASAARPTPVLSCHGIDGATTGAVQFCPQSGPGFSPDGRTLVTAGTEFQADGSSSPDQSVCNDYESCPKGLILAATDGGGPHLMSLGLADAEHPAFLPDGGHIVFAGRTIRDGPKDLYTVAIDGSRLARLTASGADDPAPCPNGTIIYVHRGDLYRRSAAGVVVRLTRAGGASLPDCAHDSAAIVFLRRATVYTTTITGRHLRRLSTPGVAYGTPAFSPAGGRIAFYAVRRCTSHCGDIYPQCTNLTDRVEVIDLAGRRRGAVNVGRNYCSADGDLGGDAIEGLAWQPLLAAAP